MSSNMKQALATAKAAIKLDNEGNKFEALRSYEEAVNSLRQSLTLNEAQNLHIQQELERQLGIYTNKVEELRRVFTQELNQNISQTEYEDPELVKRVESTIVNVRPNENFESVAGLHEEKEFLYEAVVLPIEHPELFDEDVKPYSAFLLFGPPGTGKSYLARAVAGEAKKTTFFSLSASDLVSKYQGESEMLIKSLFATARKRKPSIIFIDEIDSLALSRSDSDNDGSRRIKTELFVQIQGAMSDNSGVFVLAASNTPQDLDDAVLRRFDKLLYIPLPCFDARRDMLQMRFTRTSGLTEKLLDELATKTEGFSGSDIEILSKKAKLQSIAKLRKCCYFIPSKIDGTTYFTPCVSKSKGAIKMNLSDVPEGSLRHSICATPEDILKCVREASPRIDQAKLRRLETFAEERAEKMSPANLDIITKKSSKASKFFAFVLGILD